MYVLVQESVNDALQMLITKDLFSHIFNLVEKLNIFISFLFLPGYVHVSRTRRCFLGKGESEGKLSGKENAHFFVIISDIGKRNTKAALNNHMEFSFNIREHLLITSIKFSDFSDPFLVRNWNRFVV